MTKHHKIWKHVHGIAGMVFEPGQQPASERKHNCPDCLVCQMCSDSRCSKCLKRKTCLKKSKRI
ncbi:MAG: hypothetical protein A2283_22200 [Lentisphaerae bacterium RIFOXYA12_FULL_48_11]|nr:MAG: hypothetical protein A2283_22200 [Lentisphaerae bacterium RIFOXYA12_FULL_48_11]